MTNFSEYFEAILDPTETNISQTLSLMNNEAMHKDKNIKKLVDDYNVTTDLNVKTANLAAMDIELKRMELYEKRIGKLLKLQKKFQREKNEKLQKTKCVEGVVNEVVCGICNVKSIGLQIPNSPIIVCLNCIYATVLEHQTKKDWVAQQNTIKENSDKEEK